VSAVLRVLWLFYTAFPLQRWLAAVGAAIGGVLIVIGLLASEARAGIGVGALTFTIFTAFPAMFAGGALLRALSAPRSHQLFPHFRSRALLAAMLLVASLVLWFGIGLALPPLLENRAVPPTVLIYPFGFVTAVFVWVWLFSGDWRWGPAFLLLPLGFIALVRTGPGAPDAGSLPLIPVLIGASLAWVVFAVWYLRARRVRPMMLTPAGPGVDSWTEQPTREAAIRATIAWNGQPSLARPFLAGLRNGGAIGIGLLVLIVFVVPRVERLPMLTSVIWPLVSMSLVGAVVGRVVRQSRLLWLKIAGGRDEIRQRIERAAWRTGSATFAFVMTTALIVTIPLGGTARELILGVMLCTSAAAYGGYVSLASVPGVRVQVVGAGLMAVAQIALLARAEPALTSIAIILVAQLVGAVLCRVLAVRRWRRIDWRLVQLPRGAEGVP
jgi:hypothetical protein